jgi:hypothetical protein
MKTTLAICMLALAIAVSVISYRATAKPCGNSACASARTEACVGMECWPPTPRVTHSRSLRVTLPPVW